MKNHEKEVLSYIWGLEVWCKIKTGIKKVPKVNTLLSSEEFFYEDWPSLSIFIFLQGEYQQNQKKPESKSLVESLLLPNPSQTA